jgi:hypothetical protein
MNTACKSGDFSGDCWSAISELLQLLFGFVPGFEKAWQKLMTTRTEALYELWRQSRDLHAWKDRMHQERLPMPTQNRDDRAQCF